VNIAIVHDGDDDEQPLTSAPMQRSAKRRPAPQWRSVHPKIKIVLLLVVNSTINPYKIAVVHQSSLTFFISDADLFDSFAFKCNDAALFTFVVVIAIVSSF